MTSYLQKNVEHDLMLSTKPYSTPLVLLTGVLNSDGAYKGCQLNTILANIFEVKVKDVNNGIQFPFYYKETCFVRYYDVEHIVEHKSSRVYSSTSVVIISPLLVKPKQTLSLHSVCPSVSPSVCPSVCLSVRSISFADFFPKHLQILS